MRRFDELRLAKDFDNQLRLAKDFAQGLWIPSNQKKQKKKRKKQQPSEEELEELARQEEERKQQQEDEELEEFLLLLTYILCAIYALGWKDAEDFIGEEVDVDWNYDLETVDALIDGKTFSDRIRESETLEEVERIIETEAHRDYNAGLFKAAQESGKNLLKTWHTMRDERVRDSHQYLEGVTVGLNDYFYTAGGSTALYPGQFGIPDEDINCRCWIELTEV